MSGVAFDIKETGLSEAILKIEGLERLMQTHNLPDSIGRMVQEQTRRRILEEKTSPAGAAWKPNRAGTSILEQSGALAESIDYVADPSNVTVGSGLVYALIHNEGGKISAKSAKALAFMSGGHLVQVKSVTLPQRQYLGLSSENQEDLIGMVEDAVERLVQ